MVEKLSFVSVFPKGQLEHQKVNQTSFLLLLCFAWVFCLTSSDKEQIDLPNLESRFTFAIVFQIRYSERSYWSDKCLTFVFYCILYSSPISVYCSQDANYIFYTFMLHFYAPFECFCHSKVYWFEVVRPAFEQQGEDITLPFSCPFYFEKYFFDN